MNRFETLWKGYREGLLTEAELTEFLRMVREEDNPLPEKIDELLQQGLAAAPAPGEKEAILQQLRDRMQVPAAEAGRVHWLRRYRWAAAAIFLLLTGTATWFSHQQHRNAITGTGRPSLPVYDAAPGKNGAVLTLADGSSIILDSAAQGRLATQGNTAVMLQNGALSYERKAGQPGDLQANNTITTPRGRQFQLSLPDGSKVWLNAGTTLTYPVSFTGHERRVKLSGEAYFEIASLITSTGKMPFIVEAGSMAVEVVGTHFNINAYHDEPAVKTTLLEGKVKVSAVTLLAAQRHAVVALHPGEQATMGHTPSANIRVQPANVDQAVAWKNGLFNFQKVDLPTVMRQLARWYDVEVQYRGPVPDRLFGGEIERNLQLSQVLKILNKMGVACTIENKKLIVH